MFRGICKFFSFFNPTIVSLSTVEKVTFRITSSTCFGYEDQMGKTRILDIFEKDQSVSHLMEGLGERFLSKTTENRLILI